jgi:hypothetical protein
MLPTSGIVRCRPAQLNAPYVTRLSSGFLHPLNYRNAGHPHGYHDDSPAHAGYNRECNQVQVVPRNRVSPRRGAGCSAP